MTQSNYRHAASKAEEIERIEARMACRDYDRVTNRRRKD